MKKIILLTLISLSYNISAQVGINTTSPSATFDVVAKAPTGNTTTTDGLLIPRVDRQRAQSMTGAPISTIIFVNNIATGTQTGTAINIDGTGFYYYDGTFWVKIATGSILNIYNSDGLLTSPRNVNLDGNNLSFTGTGNVGIGTATPTAKIEIASGIIGISGLKFTNINDATPSTQNAATLGIDTNGNVVIQNTTPLASSFKSFNISSTTPTSSIVTLGTLEFRYPSISCTTTPTYIQVRSTSGSNNVGILHAAFTTSQITAETKFVNTDILTATPTFTDIIALPITCYNDGHAQFNFISYTDKTFYRVNINVSDGDSLGFGAMGYIFAELQR